MVVMAEPNPDSLLAALEEAVQRVHTVDPMLQHQQVTSCCALLCDQLQAAKVHTVYACRLVLVMKNAVPVTLLQG